MEIKGMPSLINTTPITLTPEQIAAGKAGGEKIKEMIDSGAIDMKNPEGKPLTPGVIYHPSNPSPSQPTEPGTPLVAVITYIGRTEPTKDFPAAHDRLMAAHDNLKTTYMQFLDDLKNIDPALEEKDFGFTVDPQGQLKATSLSGSISTEDLSRLSDFMNQSGALKDAANEYAKSSFDFVKEDREYLGTGGFVLNKDNFEKTIDLGQLFTYQKSGNMNMSNYFFNQVYTKGERAPHTV
ncbi:hypothetical protein BK666_18975 [Pseudomonas frederiksbergensis]|uniref:Uncharacterized protein n=1 Tax=Pseudomonas frederiksbergensis TaxID=104087 RepID=A0A423JYX2_9PSED|nr:hypothetical protein [Pseudomonas frederiksbergensis]RON43183.1 hypothetical protein BK666_18975 [Pseudomonas frederiksbergensis]